ncbi:MAG TPA: hypothetical protein VGM56_10345 [Byssovorax sp.]
MTAAREPTGADAPRASGRARRSKTRDMQDGSAFSQILDDLVRLTPGAVAAALVDAEGETVDYAGYLEVFDVKIAAAHWQIALRALDEENITRPQQIVIRARAKSYVLRSIGPESYAVVLIVHKHAAFAVSERAMSDVDARLSREAGWPVRRDSEWCSVEIETRAETTPPRARASNGEKSSRAAREELRPARMRVAGTWQPLEVMGCLVGLRAGERGYRVRLPTGVEMTLVRERFGRWFSDERIES